MSAILSLTPTGVWKNFHAITQIPHPSGLIEPIVNFMLDFAKNLGLEAKRDTIGNVVIYKPATVGMENKPTVVLQSHLDMVPQKNNGVAHNFETDPIETIIADGWVKANQTTLGADNGVGVAAIMAILEATDLVHGPIEALFTVDEETGMFGAFELTSESFSGRTLLNLDTEHEGALCIGCAGGVNVNADLQYQEVEAPTGDLTYEITLKGLKGGHSGVDIHLGRANANKLMFRFLKQAVQELDVCLASFEGGTLHNAIPREATAVVTIQPENIDALEELIADYEAIFIEEFDSIEENISLTATPSATATTNIIPEEIQDSIINAMMACPNGVLRMIPTMPNTVETSNNLSVVRVGKGEMSVILLVRSSSDSCKEYLSSMIESAFALTGAKVVFEGDYSGWNPNVNSPILQVMKNNYQELYGVEPLVGTVHAGLECGIIGACVPGMDMISFGPTIMYPHSPDEKLEINSVQKFWDLLVATLAKI